MSGLKLKLRNPPPERLDMSRIVPGLLAALPIIEIERLDVGTSRIGVKLADLFTVTGGAGDALAIEGGSDRLDFVGASHGGGTIVVEGDVGAYAGWRMSSGRLDIRGKAGPWLASGLSGGLVSVAGDAGDYLGAPRAGERFGMAGGTVVVAGNAGARAGDRMRRGTIIARGKCGPLAGARIMGGTIWAEGGFAESAGAMMRRGTLIAPSGTRVAPTFVDCGQHELVILRIMSSHFASALGQLAPKPLPGLARRFAGDMAALGKGEILLLG